MADGGNSVWDGLIGTDHLRSADEALALIEKETGRPYNLDITGFRMAVMLQVRPNKTKGGILLTSNYIDLDPRRNRCGLVIAMGEECYKGVDQFGVPRFTTPYCNVGDWVLFDRYDATASLFKYRGKFAMGICVDERISGVVGDPNDIVAIRMEDLY